MCGQKRFLRIGSFTRNSESALPQIECQDCIIRDGDNFPGNELFRALVSRGKKGMICY